MKLQLDKMITRTVLVGFVKASGNTIKYYHSGYNLTSGTTHKLASYPPTEKLSLPSNVKYVVDNEIGRFSPERHRDINNSLMNIRTMNEPTWTDQAVTTDSRIALYDCKSLVNLKCAMQSITPTAYSPSGYSGHSYRDLPLVHLKHDENKLLSSYLQKATLVKHEGIRMFSTLIYNTRNKNFVCDLSRYESTKPSTHKEPVLSRKDKLKRAVTEYGSTVIVFHVGISLVSLGTCYVLVSSGIDMGQILIPLGVSGTAAANAGTFVTAYAIHKVFAPVRISITLASTPFIVRYLRKIGFLKKPKAQ